MRLLILTLVFTCSIRYALGQNQSDAKSGSAASEPYKASSVYYAADSDGKHEGYSDSQDASAGYGTSATYFPPAQRPSYSADGTYRQPITIEFIDAYVAIVPTKLTGQLFLYDTRARSVECLYTNPDRRWTQVTSLGRSCFAVIDIAASSVVIFRRQGLLLEMLDEISCDGVPNALHWLPDSPSEKNLVDFEAGTLYVSTTWSQQLHRVRAGVDAQTNAWTWTKTSITNLPMCGGEVLPLPSRGVVLVTDAFGRDYAVVDAVTAEVVKHDQFYGHNISQIAAVEGGARVMFTHQLLNELAQSVRGDITWGGLLSNNIRWLQTERVLNETGPQIFSKGRFYPIGMAGEGAGDPSSFALSGTGSIAVTLAGTDRVAIAQLDDLDFRQIDVGYRPLDCEFSPDETQLIVVNQFSDSLTVIDTGDFTVSQIAIGKLREPTAVERGERLFFHSKIAHDNWMSCHSCHSHGHTSGQLNDNLTDESFGTPKRIPSLLGQAETQPYSWNGKFDRLEDQVFHSIRSTMATDNPIDATTVSDIAAYVRSLPEPPSLLEARKQRPEEKQMQDGARLFAKLGCAECHAGDRFTSDLVVDVGLVDEASAKLFNPPSLLAVSQRQSTLFHDSRAKSLREVVEVYQHQLPREVTDADKECLIEFLQAL